MTTCQSYCRFNHKKIPHKIGLNSVSFLRSPTRKTGTLGNTFVAFSPLFSSVTSCGFQVKESVIFFVDS